jgi:hypothetical protein
MVNVAPLPSVLLVAYSSPPCASIIFLEIYRPNPVPLLDLVANFENSLGNISECIPVPVSLIVMIVYCCFCSCSRCPPFSIRSPSCCCSCCGRSTCCFSTVTITLPSASVNFNALSRIL